MTLVTGMLAKASAIRSFRRPRPSLMATALAALPSAAANEPGHPGLSGNSTQGSNHPGGGHGAASPAAIASHLKREEYLKQYWIFLGSVICFAILVHAITLLLSILRTRRRGSKSASSISEKDVERNTKSSPPSATSRIVSTMITGLRIIFTRLTIPLGFNAVASGLEAAIIIGYLLATFLWLLLDSKCSRSLSGILTYPAISKQPQQVILDG
jgi:hypothetical protein